MLSLLAQLLKALLWYLGVGRKKSEDERHEETAAREAELEVRNEDLEQALAAEKKARETESRMEQAQNPSLSPPRKARPGQKVFLLILPILLLSGLNCTHLRPSDEVAPPPLTAAACPRIPLTPEPRLPDLSIPEPQGGLYCFTQEEMDNILGGIDALKQNNRVMRDTITIYNEAYATRKEN